MNYRFWILVVWLVGVGCSQSPESKLFTEMNSDATGISFANNLTETESYNIFKYRNYYNGGGVAIGDINNDGLMDIYFTANMQKNQLYLNKGNWQFEDITAKAGVAGTKSWSTGVAMADVNGDGLLDIYVCNSGDVEGGNKENELFINNGNLTFTERAVEYGLADKGFSTHASFFDYDGDGDLDCYLLNNSFKSVDRVELFTKRREEREWEGGDKLLRNDGGKFTDVSEQAGIYGGSVGFGLGVSVSDLNGDMLPDIYVANDFWERDYLYINQGDGTFSEEIIQRTGSISGSSMGADVADLDNDGAPEIYTTEMLPPDQRRLKTMTRFDETNVKELKVRSDYHVQLLQNCLHFNDGDGRFQEMAALSGTMATDWSWGALIFDMDNDGWKDIFVSNGILRDITSMDFSTFVSDREQVKKIVMEKGKFDFDDLLSYIPSTPLPNVAFVNQRNRMFKDRAQEWGLGKPTFSNGAAYGDLDNDGDWDLVVNNLNAEALVYRNQTIEKQTNHYLKFQLKGPAQNAWGIGARVTVFAQGSSQVQQLYPSRGFQSSVAPELIFGLGAVTQLDSIEVIWPDRRAQMLRGIAADQTLMLQHAKANDIFQPENALNKADIFEEITQGALNSDLRHTENDFNDFNHERLLLHKLSTEGPKIITGDVNGDGLDDFVLGGAFGDPDKLLIQTMDGRFERVFQEAFVQDSIYETTAGALLDADSDGDLDLLLASGGNEFARGMDAHYLRYYENDGQGNFARVLHRTPSAVGNFSVILAQDFDQDGDADIFLGGRSVPGNFGLVPRSYLFRNSEEGWEEMAPESLGGVGMVTDAVWSDFNADGKLDLLVVGEWMPIMVYINRGTSLEEGQALPGTEGWWNTIEAADLNKDGVEEYVLGNWGLNSKFTASAEKPLQLYVSDFDGNGKSEFVVNWYPPAEAQSFPFAAKSDLASQMPILKKKAVTHEEYARHTYESLFTEEQRAKAKAYRVTTLETSVLWHNGDKLSLEALPVAAQVAPVHSIVVDDLDGDGFRDLLLMGNCYGLKPEVGMQTANNGVFLRGDGCGGWKPLGHRATGLRVTGEVRDAKILPTATGRVLLIGRNNDSALMYQLLQ